MTNKQIKNLKDTLWTTADQLRANPVQDRGYRSGLHSLHLQHRKVDAEHLAFAPSNRFGDAGANL